MSKQFKYAKYIVSKMSFDRKLQLKEYLKAIKMLNSDEVSVLRKWYLKEILAKQ